MIWRFDAFMNRKESVKTRKMLEVLNMNRLICQYIVSKLYK